MENMTVWMDMTNSLITWKGGIVGIIRAEMEVAKHLKMIDPDLCVSVYDSGCFIKVSEKEMDWLWDANMATTAYLRKMGRKTERTEKEKKDQPEHEYEALREAYYYSPSHVARFKQAGRLFIEASPLIARPPLWLLWFFAALPLSLASKIVNHIRHYRAAHPKKKHKSRKDKTAANSPFSHPYKNGDKIFSMGWITSGKEAGFSKVRSEMKNICMIYLIYDLILLNKETTHLYDQVIGVPEFRRYYEWALSNCDYLLYGGETTKRDSETYQRKRVMRLIPGFSVRFGCNLFNASEKIRIEDVRKHYKIGGRFILAVGSVEPRKNYDTIYRAYMMLSETYAHGLPQLLIIGSVSSDSAGIADIIKSDPGAAKYIRIIQPTDSELDVLYKNCEFTILPSLYEGWSLTLPEALSYGKLCVAVDIPPIREAGGAFIRYVPKKDAQNPAVWAEALQWCFDHPNKVLEYEKRIHLDYTALTWRDCAEEINDALAKCNVTERPYQTYFDLTLTWHAAYSNIRITGILRSELMLLRALNKIRKDIKYFAICSRGFFDIDRDTLEILFENMDLGYAFDMSRERIIAQVNKATARRIPVTRYAKAFWMLCSALPSSFQSQLIKLKNRTLISQKYLDPQYSPVPIDEMTEYSIELPDLPFQRGDLIFSSGIEGFPSSYATLINAKKEKGFKFVQLMYDFTPMLTPQTHQKITVSRYIPFAEYVAKISDLVLYGGATAMRDGEKYYREKGFPVPKGVPLKLGADISGSEIAHVVAHDEKILKDLQLDDNFIIIVGTWEYRKNHQALYNAYTRLIEEGLADKIPQLVFCGHPGWKTEHLIHSILNDSRLQGKIMLRTPSDEQLDVLYRNCLFTVLPSLYEGWSLTLPESMRYGKFCIASDVAPLRETGGNFADYVHPYDVAGWADKIYFYANNAFALKAREEKIKNEWHSVTWAECAEEINQHLIMLGETEYEN